jgi:hypothetical protein
MTIDDKNKLTKRFNMQNDAERNRLAHGVMGGSAPPSATDVPPTPSSAAENRGLRMPPERNAAEFYRSSLARPEVSGLYFNGKHVRLEGYRFVGCRFDNCQIEIASHNFEIIGCVIDASSSFNYMGDVLNVVKLFNSRVGDWVYNAFPDFSPIRHKDGSITIESRRS